MNDTGFDLQQWLGPVVGAVLSLAIAPAKNWIEAIINVTVGIMLAYYLTPIFIHLTELPDSLRDGAGFAVGFVGLITIRIFISVLKQLGVDLPAIIKALRGGK